MEKSKVIEIGLNESSELSRMTAGDIAAMRLFATSLTEPWDGVPRVAAYLGAPSLITVTEEGQGS